MISIVDYGMGNLGSILNMFKRLGHQAELVNTVNQIVSSNKLLLPGVGSFDKAMERIHDLGYYEPLCELALVKKIPVLGICLGMQLLTNGSEEGSRSGLGWIGGHARRFPLGTNLKVPHMGWNEVKPAMNSPLIDGLPEDSRFYFVHSYYIKVEIPENSLLTCHYGFDFDAGIHKDNIFGVQFHPEKSHKFGMKLLDNFAKL